MKRFWAAFLSILLLVPFGSAVAEEKSPASFAGEYEEHEALVLMASEKPSSVSPFSRSVNILDSAELLMSVTEETCEELNASTNLSSMQTEGLSRVSPLALQNNNEEAKGAEIRLVRDDSRTTEELMAFLEQDERVIFAEPNWRVKQNDEEVAVPQKQEQDQKQELLAQTIDDGLSRQLISQNSTPQANPTKDLTGFQWGMKNSGALGGADSAGIDLDYGNWNTTTGTTRDDIVVAVIDSGIDASHPDLRDKMWSRAGYPELANIGDEHGFSGIPGNLSTDDSNGHGTHCAGVIGAAWDGKGISGVSQNARLMAVQYGSRLSAMMQCFDYISKAADAGVNVRLASCSWGFGTFQSRVLNAAVTEIGLKGVTTIFASGNESYNGDVAANTQSTLKDNPYAVVVNSIDPSGDMTYFSNYGKATTDIMSPGTTILSTYPIDTPNYNGEADSNAVVYESFDDASYASVSGNAPYLNFNTGSVFLTRAFDGSKSWGFSYDPQVSPGKATARSNPVDLSNVAEKPKYLSIRYSSEDIAAGLNGEARLTLKIRQQDGSYASLEKEQESEGTGSSWASFYVDVPAETDFANFQLEIEYSLVALTEVSSVKTESPTKGTLLIDSIGLGSTTSPYKFMRGTSMACPGVTGVAAVLCEQYGDASAEKLAARVRGSFIEDARYRELCSSGGRASIDSASNPAPAITKVDSEDATNFIEVTGFFFGNNPQVTVAGKSCIIEEAVDFGNEKQVLRATLSQDFAGGNAEVQVINSINGKSGRSFSVISKSRETPYYDQVELPIFEGAENWGAWSLVGFNGDIYCLPRSVITPLVEYDHIQRYDPKAATWARIDLPEEIIDQYGFATDISATTWQEKLLVQIVSGDYDSPYAAYWTYSKEGIWEKLAHRTDARASVCMGSIINVGKDVYYLGDALPEEGGGDAVMILDPLTGDRSPVGVMGIPRSFSQLACREGSLLLTGGVESHGAELLSLSGESLKSVSIDFSSLITETGFLSYAGGATKEGFIAAGPRSDDGKADTYIVDPSGSPVKAYGKLASDYALIHPAGTAYRGSYYVFAATTDADPARVFSATAVETLEQPGDVVDDPVDPPVPPVDPADEGNSNNEKGLAETGDNSLMPFVVGAAFLAGVLMCAGRRRVLSLQD